MTGVQTCALPIYGVGLLSKDKPLGSKIVPLTGAEPRVLLVVEFKKYVVAVTHFPLTPNERKECADIVIDQLKDIEKPLFMAGDFNATPENKTVETLSRHFKMLSNPAQATYPSPVASECIDYIWGMKGGHSFEVSQAVTLSGVEASDHLPFFVDVRITK